ncbi:putative diguanylate cyclase YegE [mine drainage metagenome]|uniref:Putative diguanylate cyclase YegE n=1 Tax=mine drainage metagenome TaxID=410659 RepID=A0A1J5T5S4_9ZZZZ
MVEKKVPHTASASEGNVHLHNHFGHLAFHDPLTGLPNRDLFVERMNRELARVRRYESGFALIMLDLDEFEAVNDANGHDAGDLVLCDVANHLASAVRDVDTVARTGGDEFAILLDGVTSKKEAEIVALKIIKSMSAPIRLGNGTQIKIGASAGIVLSPQDGYLAEQLMQCANQAMNVAKNNGKGLIGFSRNLQTAPKASQPSPPPPGSMILGISILDEQHKAMSNFIQGIIESLKNGDHSTKLLKRVELLVELCRIHFKTEEDMMQLYDIEGLDEHRTEHQVKLKNLRSIFGNLNFNEKELAKLTHDANEWLCEHIREQDTELVAQLKKKGVF